MLDFDFQVLVTHLLESFVCCLEVEIIFAIFNRVNDESHGLALFGSDEETDLFVRGFSALALIVIHDLFYVLHYLESNGLLDHLILSSVGVEEEYSSTCLEDKSIHTLTYLLSENLG